ncbi:MAG: sugar kinase [Nanoarchaeota archaeon]|nr:sugar kinase [Nanoarchaeota archaeon]
MLVTVGSLAFDDITTPFGKATRAIGGSATYFSLAASLFTKVGVIASVGTDFPQEQLQVMRQRGIDTSGVITTRDKTLHWSGYYEYDMNEAHTKSIDLGPYANFVPTVPEAYATAEYVFLANIDPKMQLQVLAGIKHPKLVAVDTMNFYIEKDPQAVKDVIRKVDIFFCNEWEARELFQTPNLVKAGKEALALGARWAVIKKGEHGVLLLSKDSIVSLPGYPLENVVDPTGAGDSFAGGFMGYLASTGDLSEAGIRRAAVHGTAVASFTAEGLATKRISELTNAEVDQRIAALKQLVHF